MKYWLVKSDTADYSLETFRKEKKTLWTGVRNFQARNFLLEMGRGDLVLFYQSVTEPIGLAGLAKVETPAVPDPTQFDRKSKYFEPRATKEKPFWFCPRLAFKRGFKTVVGLAVLRGAKELQSSALLRRGNRLSVLPLTEKEFKLMLDLAE